MGRTRRRRRLRFDRLEARSLLTTLLALTDSDSLLAFDSSSPGNLSRIIPIQGLPSGETIASVDIRPSDGTLFGIGTLDHLYKINLGTGTATAVSSTPFTPGLVGVRFAADTNPVTGQIRIVTDAGQNLRLDTTTGQVVGTGDVSLSYATGDPHAGTQPDVVALSYSNNAPGAISTTAYAIDAALGNLVELGSPGGAPTAPETGLLTTVGPIGVPLSSSAELDLVGPSNNAYAALTPNAGADSGVPGLYTVNIATGAATRVGTIGDGGAPVLGLAATNLSPPSAPTLDPTSDSGPSNADHITNVRSPLIDGTSLPNALVTIDANGVTVGNGQADAAGHYSVRITPLVDGTYNVVALQADGSGLISGASAPMSPPLVILTTPPAAPGVPTLVPGYDTGFSATDNFTRATAPQIYGGGVPGDTVSLFANGTLIGTGQVNAFNQYVIQSGHLADGTYQLTAIQTDLAGNVGPASATTTPPLVVNSGSRPLPAQAYVGQLYQDLLFRAADQSALDQWVPLVYQAGGPATIVGGILGTDAYRTAVVQNDYQTLLGRSVDTPSLNASLSFLRSHTDEQLRAILVGSAEYFKDQGGTTTGFVTAAYLDLTGTAVDPTSLALYSSQISRGSALSTVAYEILATPAGIAGTITQVYEMILKRAPDSSGLLGASALLRQGKTDETLISILATSDEYFQAAQGNGTLLSQWGNQVYLDVLGRAADPVGLASVVAELKARVDPSRIVAGLENNNEFRSVQVTRAYQTLLGRAPEAAALAAGVSYLGSGGTIEAIRSTLLGSAEFYETSGGGSDSTFLNTLYLAVVNRPIDSGALASGLQQLAAGVPRSTLAASLIRSTEGTQETIQVLYLTYLRRVASYTELSAISALLSDAATRDQDIVAAVLGSPEYFSKL